LCSNLGGWKSAEEGSCAKPPLYDSHGRVPSDEAAAHHARFSRVLQSTFAISCTRSLSNLSDIPLRKAFLQAGWPDSSRQTPIERTLEFFVVDWDFQFPAESISLFNYFAVGDRSWLEACYRLRSGAAWRDLRLARPRRAAQYLATGNGTFAWETPRYFVTDPRGYAAIARKVAEAFLPSESAVEVALPSERNGTSKLFFNKNVTHILYGEEDSQVRVLTSAGSEYQAKAAICTFSAGVVHKAITTHTLFYPQLPSWKLDAFSKALNGVYTKIFLKFDRRFWEDADYVLYAHPQRRGYYAVWQDLESGGKFFPPGSNILLVTVVQNESKRVEVQPQEQTVREILAVLRSMYGDAVPTNGPINVVVPRWLNDPAFRGSWSNIAVGATDTDFEKMQAAVGGLFFAGEATDSHYNGFVTGGYHSGSDVALRVEIALEATKAGITIESADAS